MCARSPAPKVAVAPRGRQRTRPVGRHRARGVTHPRHDKPPRCCPLPIKVDAMPLDAGLMRCPWTPGGRTACFGWRGRACRVFAAHRPDRPPRCGMPRGQNPSGEVRGRKRTQAYKAARTRAKLCPVGRLDRGARASCAGSTGGRELVDQIEDDANAFVVDANAVAQVTDELSAGEIDLGTGKSQRRLDAARAIPPQAKAAMLSARSRAGGRILPRRAFTPRPSGADCGPPGAPVPSWRSSWEGAMALYVSRRQSGRRPA